jgi:hypothetical protein
MDVVELLKDMKEACKIKCDCSIELEDDNLILKWDGKVWGHRAVISPLDLLNPNHLKMRLEHSGYAIGKLLSDINKGGG